MPKSRNRKNHKKKVQARNMRLKGEQKKMMEQMEVLKDQYLKEAITCYEIKNFVVLAWHLHKFQKT